MAVRRTRRLMMENESWSPEMQGMANSLTRCLVHANARKANVAMVAVGVIKQSWATVLTENSVEDVLADDDQSNDGSEDTLIGSIVISCVSLC